VGVKFLAYICTSGQISVSIKVLATSLDFLSGGWDLWTRTRLGRVHASFTGGRETAAQDVTFHAEAILPPARDRRF
jgi:hypothetical protein